jgi:hypothetical protein
MPHYLDFRLGATEMDRSSHRCRMSNLNHVRHGAMVILGGGAQEFPNFLGNPQRD